VPVQVLCLFSSACISYLLCNVVQFDDLLSYVDGAFDDAFAMVLIVTSLSAENLVSVVPTCAGLLRLAS